MNSTGTQPDMYMDPFYPNHHHPPNTHPSRLARNTAEFHVLYSRSLLVIHFKCSSVYMTFPNSLTIPSPWQP